jgi:hydrogenase/urease accessory protein HupE
MSPARQLQLAALLFLLAGVAFIAAAILGGQVMFYGVAAPFFALSVIYSVRARKARTGGS